MTDTDPTTRSPALSVVVPTLNEAEGIANCLDSIFQACDSISSFEVILVDSNSEDDTIEIASDYPITVLQLSPSEQISPGAGRYVGTEAARGARILFVDGDMTLTSEWLTEAIRLLDEENGVAGVGGHLNECNADSIRTVKALHGVMLFDTQALSEVGGFDPFLAAYEDIELGLRIRAAGYELVELPTVVATHERARDVTELRRRWQNGYLFGYGQAVRKSLTSPRVLRELLGWKWLELLFLGWIGAGVALAFLSLRAMLGWIALTVGLFVADALYEGVRPATMRFLWQVFSWPSYVYGFVRGSHGPSAFPLDSVSVVATPETRRPFPTDS